jgi:hypothetical protein
LCLFDDTLAIQKTSVTLQQQQVLFNGNKAINS